MKKTYIFDIDNTLCNTWPTLRVIRTKLIFFRFIDETRRISNIPIFENMATCVKRRKKRGDSNVYFLSARHWSLWPVTYLYLIRHIGFFNPSHLILVPSAKLKIVSYDRFLRLFIGPIVVVDDLSYNTEVGETLFYHDVIEYLKANHLRIRYVGKEKIDYINKVEIRAVL